MKTICGAWICALAILAIAATGCCCYDEPCGYYYGGPYYGYCYGPHYGYYHYGHWR